MAAPDGNEHSGVTHNDDKERHGVKQHDKANVPWNRSKILKCFKHFCQAINFKHVIFSIYLFKLHFNESMLFDLNLKRQQLLWRNDYLSAII